MSRVEVRWQQKCCTEKRVLIVSTLKAFSDNLNHHKSYATRHGGARPYGGVNAQWKDIGK